MRVKTEANQSFYEKAKSNKPLAQKSLELAKQQEAEKLKKGYKYVRIGNTLTLKKSHQIKDEN